MGYIACAIVLSILLVPGLCGESADRSVVYHNLMQWAVANGAKFAFELRKVSDHNWAAWATRDVEVDPL
jgi:hypothetical protein